MTTWRREVNERNFESSVKMSLVYSPNFTIGSGHRVSQTEDSTTFNPSYELVSINKDGLPENFLNMLVFRFTENMRTLQVDTMGKGDSAAEVLRARLRVRKFETLKDHLTIRS